MAKTLSPLWWCRGAMETTRDVLCGSGVPQAHMAYLAWLGSPAHLKFPGPQSSLPTWHSLCPGTTFEFCRPLSRGRPF